MKTKVSVSKDIFRLDGWSTSKTEWICGRCQIFIVQDELDKCPRCGKRKFIVKKEGPIQDYEDFIKKCQKKT